MKKLLGVGACYLDTILNVDHYPAEDEKLRASSLIKRRGGNCPNTLEVLQQLLDNGNHVAPITVALCSVLPSFSSPGYQEIRASLDPAIDLTHCISREDSSEPASSYIIRSLAVDSRTIVNYNGLREMTAVEFASIAGKLGNELGWCHFEGRIPDVTRACIQRLRTYSPNVNISVEVEKPGREGLQELAELADVVFYSKSWAQGKGYKSAEECLRAQAETRSTPYESLLICTWGESGVSAFEPNSQVYKMCPAFRMKGQKVVDTVGAGDTFIAGMLFGLTCQVDDWTLERKLEFANELAGRKVVQEGFAGLGRAIQYSASRPS